MRVIWSPRALTRVEEIAGVIGVDRAVVPEFGRAEIRQLVYAPYRVIYRRGQGRIIILTVRHSRQEFDAAELNPG